MSMLYTTSTNHFGMYEVDSFLPAKNYYAVKALGQTIHFYPERVKAEVCCEKLENRSCVQATADINEKGDLSLVVANYKNGESTFEITIGDNYNSVEVMAVSDEHSLDSIPFTYENGIVKTECRHHSSTLWVKANR